MLTMEDVRPIPRHLIPLSRCLVFTMAEVTLWPLTVLKKKNQKLVLLSILAEKCGAIPGIEMLLGRQM